MSIINERLIRTKDSKVGKVPRQTQKQNEDCLERKGAKKRASRQKV